MILSFDSPIQRIALEVNGSDGALRLPDQNYFRVTARSSASTAPRAWWPQAGPGVRGRGSGVVDLIRTLRDGVPERASGALAYHVIDVMLATDEAGRRDTRLQYRAG